MSDASIKKAIRDKYGQAARRAGDGCCGTSISTGPISANLYSDQETSALPEAAVAVSLGCGNPTALAELKPGETVLDLGSGGGIDVLLSARRVGPTGKAYGLDRAGLHHCSAHGLRKTGATIAANNGATAHQLMAIFGWDTLKEAEKYTANADQRRLDESAMHLLAASRHE